MKYVVVRYGSNKANQHMVNRMVLGEIEADSPDAALPTLRRQLNTGNSNVRPTTGDER